MLAIEPSLSQPTTAADFEARLLRFINEKMPQLDRRSHTWEHVSSHTPLFSTGLLDSLSILHLIAAVEELTGRAVPDQLVVMKYFQTVEAMTAAFWPPDSDNQL